MNETRQPGHSYDEEYPFGIIIAVLRNTFLLTIASYILFVSGTLAGLFTAGESDIFIWFVVFVFPYLFLCFFSDGCYLSTTFGLLAIVLCWYCAIWSESVLIRLLMLFAIFLVSFFSALLCFAQ